MYYYHGGDRWMGGMVAIVGHGGRGRAGGRGRSRRNGTAGNSADDETIFGRKQNGKTKRH